MRIAAENFSNAESVARVPGGVPYRRKVPSFKTEYDAITDTEILRPDALLCDQSPFKMAYEPHHPAADPETGRYPNVEPHLEFLDFKEASIAQSAMVQCYALLTTMFHRVYEMMTRT